jgi:toxin ParE1/3/4
VKPVRFHADAETELTGEAQYYEDRSPGLGERFIREVQTAVALASAFPGIGSPYKYRTRRVFPKKFPFSVVYLELPAELVILAIAPFPRKPAYWRDRKPR